MRLAAPCRWLELLPVGAHDIRGRRPVDMRGEREPEPQLRREGSAEPARPEQPNRWQRDIVRDRLDWGEQVVFREAAIDVGEHLRDVLRVVLGGHRVRVAPERVGGALVGSRRPSEAKIDAARVERLEQPEDLGNLERCLVGKHDATGTDADARGLVGDMPDHDLRRAAGESGGIVVLGEPDAFVVELFGELCHRHGSGDGIGGRLVLDDSHQVENGKRPGHGFIPR